MFNIFRKNKPSSSAPVAKPPVSTASLDEVAPTINKEEPKKLQHRKSPPMVGVRLGRLHDVFKAQCEAEGMTGPELVRAALVAYFEEHQGDAVNVTGKRDLAGTASLNLKVSQMVIDALDQVATEKGFTRSKAARLALRSSLDSADFADLDKLKAMLDELKVFRGELSRVGSNLNQIALAYNMEDVIDDEALKTSHEELRETFRFVDESLKVIQNAITGLQR
jgi:hypothetical protein